MTGPNLVLIVLDTARADEVFHRGSDGPVMPTLRSLASSGTRFTDASANAPWTLPSHATLFTGEPPSVHGAHAAHKAFEYGPTLATRLRTAGYRTVGVSNNTWISGEFGFDRGFDEFLTSWQLFQDGVDFGGVARERTGLLSQLAGIAAEFRGNPIKNLGNLVYGKFFRKRTDDGARRTNRLIEDRLDSWLAGPEPLFLFVNYLEPHLEYRPARKHAQSWLPADVTYEQAMDVNQDAWAYITGQKPMSERDFRVLRGLYRAELSYLDKRIADLLSLFEAAGVREDTVFVVVGDHGEHIGEHELMDHQYSLSEELLSVPLVVSGPGFDDGCRVDAPVQLADIPATLLDLGAADTALETPVAPQSLVDTTSLSAQRPLFAEYLAPQPPVETLQNRYDCDRDISQYDRRLRSLRVGDNKLVRGSEGSRWLVNLDENRAVSVDSEEADSALAETLATQIDEWVADLPLVADEPVTEMNAATRTRLEDLGYLQ